MIGPELTKLSMTGLPRATAMLQVDVIADLVCPWSYLGKKRLDDALSAVHGPSMVTWYPYQLNPNMPLSGQPFEEYVQSKFGDPKALQPAMDQLVMSGKAEGIDFRLDRITNVPNTLNAHRLMNLAESQSADTSRLAESILQGFFSAGLDISNPDVLAELGIKVGLGLNEILSTLEDDRSRKIVLSQEGQVRQSGITSIPDFLINKRLLVIGAQQTENLVNVFDRVMFGAESDLPTSEIIH